MQFDYAQKKEKKNMLVEISGSSGSEALLSSNLSALIVIVGATSPDYAKKLAKIFELPRRSEQPDGTSMPIAATRLKRFSATQHRCFHLYSARTWFVNVVCLIYIS